MGRSGDGGVGGGGKLPHHVQDSRGRLGTIYVPRQELEGARDHYEAERRPTTLMPVGLGGGGGER